ncbi:hypothetical protein A3F66_01270 [candidate division TM6 bacterium RIFCSPHIGHO2_12_FULL_32_22]|nr:MAG: hypothetical protein A3F66_01270 [candidate division TM6 bacterium RIFCSPHIGHO2_12_FULL_32_22]
MKKQLLFLTIFLVSSLSSTALTNITRQIVAKKLYAHLTSRFLLCPAKYIHTKPGSTCRSEEICKKAKADFENNEFRFSNLEKKMDQLLCEHCHDCDGNLCEGCTEEAIRAKLFNLKVLKHKYAARKNYLEEKIKALSKKELDLDTINKYLGEEKINKQIKEALASRLKNESESLVHRLNENPKYLQKIEGEISKGVPEVEAFLKKLEDEAELKRFDMLVIKYGKNPLDVAQKALEESLKNALEKSNKKINA